MRKLTTTCVLVALASLGACSESEIESKTESQTTASVETSDSDVAPKKRRGRRGPRGDRARFDKDGDGTLDDAERAAMRQERVTGLIERLDTDKDGALSKTEVEAASSRMARGLGDFAKIDADGDGALSPAEVEAAMTARRPRGRRE